MKETLSWTDIIVAILAIYGAFLSTVIFLKEQQKSKRRIKVKLSTGYTTSVKGLSDFMLIIEFINPGFKTVTINSPELRFDDGKKLIIPYPNSNVMFPHSLEEGKNAHVWIELSHLKKELIEAGYKNSIKIKGAIFDQTGNLFMSKGWMKIRINNDL
jgi:hypothetical protein